MKPTILLCITLGLLSSAQAALTPDHWNFRQEIDIDNPGPAAKDAVVPIQLDAAFDYAAAQEKGADIRLSTSPKNIAGTSLPFWIESWNAQGTSKIWVKIPKLKKGASNKIYLSYGNPTAASASNGDATFLFFDDFESGDFTQKWTNTSIGQVQEQGGVLKLKEDDGQDGVITANFDVTGQVIIHTLYQREGGDQHWTRAGIGGWNNWLCFGDYTDFPGIGTNYVELFDENSIKDEANHPLVKVPNATINDQWRPVSYWHDGTNLNGQQDGTTVSYPLPKASSKLTLRTLDNDSWDNFAFITVSPWLKVQPIVTMGKAVSVKASR